MWHRWKSELILMTGLSLVLPHAALAGKPVIEQQARLSLSQIRDVSLDTDGSLRGAIVDPQGSPEAGTPVLICQGNRRIVATRTDGAGRFVVDGLKGGLYQVSSAQGAALCRIWKYGTAPPQALKSVLVVSDGQVVRGQLPLRLFNSGGLGTLTTVGLGLGIATAIAVPVALHNSDNGDSSP